MDSITRSAIVTGGAGGIGRVVSERLAAAGHRVVIADASAGAAEQVAASLPTPNGDHRIAAGDLTNPETNRAAVDAARELGILSVVVNGVGISPKDEGHKRPFFDISPDEWDLVMGVNVKAPLLMVQEAFRHMPSDGTGSIVNILSIVSKLGTGGLPGAPFPPYLPSSAAYAASKGALQNLTATLSRELSGFGIRVNGVAPGFVQTQMTGGVPSAETEQMIGQVPMARFAQPSEIADAIEFLISDKASYITGASLDVNGGMITC
ncbi:SDR family NAD(P)-dependent oxidoreductase [Microbacterium sp. Bi121]|uniref:SDR family NAD(P)-dependent oxidoreductase n=1 Tax=Microbacterium sp. Bi121 TaxID=2822348 RepID=UPI001DC98A8A|nr:SDR family NAD(P)-dependent oxidoreductase [Microbacterium sp. Bi121]CAH0145155.1 3-oxoacyl-[acyl-carrier-protein] reductase FabG [Microbacterium sp. Bi121]